MDLLTATPIDTIKEQLETELYVREGIPSPSLPHRHSHSFHFTHSLKTKTKTKTRNELRTARESSRAMMTIDDTEQETTLSLGVEGERVKLDQLPVAISWARVSVKSKDISPIHAFIRNLIY
jgi:hypothetical protein